ncbi:MAG TPA: type I DNA topoisomerase [Acholeplasma sp.]|nr:type I DNA topoisomerase [Acholeplasma sp.]
MSEQVIIVESPAKSKTIASYFKNQVIVLSSVGHIRDLATSGKDGLGVDVENNFDPNYKVISGKNALVKELLKKTKGKEVFLATDPDREGEAIAWHLAQVLELDLTKSNRIIFREITKPAILEAMNHPRPINLDLVNSQESRRILDRIIGFKLSKLLQSKIKSKSAGRVQSVALKLICDLEDEIEKFVQEEYYTIHAEFDGFKADYIIPRDYMIKKDEADKILATSKNLFIVESIEVKESKRNPKPPFITSTLQQDAVNNLYMSSSRVMRVAQKLYEGVEINGELVGLITYMRTDSDRLSQEFVRPTNEFIEEKFGKNYLGHYRTKKSDSAQDAHEAIRPTDIRRTPESLEGLLDKDEFKVYKRIYDRALASLMASAVYEQTKVTLNASGNLYEADGAVLVFDGFQKVLNDKTKDKVLPKLKQGQELIASNVEAIQKFTQPPTRYNEASLIKELEAKGIGRPSTYATTIETLKSRDYVEVVERRFKPTEQGRLTVRELQKFFTSIMDVEYTSRMESRLDQIAEGKVDGRKLLKAFYDNFIPQLEIANEKMEKVKPQISEKVCPLCGKQLVLRKSKYGMFYGCSGYPKCRHIEQNEVK